MNKLLLKQQLSDFFREDIGYGDQTSQAIFDEEKAVAVYMSKESGIFCGEKVIIAAYELFSKEINVTLCKRDGERIDVGDEIAKVSGPIIDLLSSERVVLNLIQRLSAIATNTNRAVEEVHGTGVDICDTRKTTPGLRMLEKYAVRCGGGKNHRFGLDDAILIKDNHIAKVGSVSKALQKVREATGHMTKIEVEIETYEQLQEAIAENPDVIMLDNCSVEDAKNWCKEIPKHITVEISGGLTVSQLRAYASTGVNVISMGALTHSVQSLDISLDILLKEGAAHV